MDQFEFNPQSGKDVQASRYPNMWDFLAFSLLLVCLMVLANTLSGLVTAHPVRAPTVDLSISALPGYALYSVVRMFLALFCSIVVAMALGTLAARSQLAARLIIPAVDVLQSLPILGYLTLAAAVFVHAFPNRSVGFEAVALFAIFTSQVWNMILSFYQSLRMVPASMQEVSAMMQFSRLQKFWRIDVPYAMPDLLMNAMISLSAGWFYVVESEAIPIGGEQMGRELLPGIGSYIWAAQKAGDSQALLAASVAMFLVIVCYDQLIFRPLSHMVGLYRANEGEQERSWIVNIVMRTKWFRSFLEALRKMGSRMLFWCSRISRRYRYQVASCVQQEVSSTEFWFIASIATLVFLWGGAQVIHRVGWRMLAWIVLCGFATALRVFAMLAVACAVWLPVGVWIGFRPRLAAWVDPVVQFLAAFPPNLLYPMMMQAILYYNLNINLWCAPLMLLGTQWYILVNVIAGVRALPKDLVYAANNMQLGRIMMWKKLILPAVSPHLVAGALAAAGGAWNASIVAEVIMWSDVRLYAVGLGAFIAQNGGHVELQAIGIVVMSAYVVLINRFFWFPLFRSVAKRYALEH